MGLNDDNRLNSILNDAMREHLQPVEVVIDSDNDAKKEYWPTKPHCCVSVTGESELFEWETKVNSKLEIKAMVLK